MKKIAYLLGLSFLLSACDQMPIFQTEQQSVAAQIAAAQSRQAATDQKTENANERIISTSPKFTSPSPTPSFQPPKPSRPPYKGPHNYSIARNGMYGYTESETGEVHFFRYDGFQNSRYTLVSFEGASASMLTCTGNCRFVDVSGIGGPHTFEVKNGTVLSGVINDMLAGALN